ncbi:N-acetylmuramoyl-L-alanine amidase [Thermoanaerobacter thermohydrosulfuricus WC1]|jgi:N-acetylmuramoyl-L-alanine amidase|uniref:Cell wall hydrolase/autolysin n=2 Tax=Thermoanaerobacter TaxID=1754 RepID=D3T326_THEIA|nr:MULTISPECIES: N-acetylmuramoyl-L-alanine amidase [Thermoanaerobacter]ADD02628.1 cell wall hydrolase/autolysin [Thermoanaerobacter italicus Ab9]EMT38890.1 N-acetylmuramoyl-L-alanine amidase [Thermoanaerobacter thermohydrosulfuricus WC1]
MAKIILDPGHGGKDPGASGNGVIEKEVTLDLAFRTKDKLLKNYEGVEIILTRSSDTYISLEDRAKIANDANADYFHSIHINAAENLAAKGYEDYIHSSLTDDSKTAKIRDVIHEEIINYLKNYGIVDRGKKKADFAVLRLTKMSAVLTENLFLTNPEESELLKNDSFLDGLADAHAKGIAKALNLPQKANTPTTVAQSNVLWLVQLGAFKNKENAERLAAELKSKGYSVFIKKETR